MAAPTRGTLGTAVKGAAVALTPVSPATANNEIEVLLCADANETLVFTDQSGFAQFTHSPQGQGTVAGTSSSGLKAFWRRATGPGMPSPVIAAPASHRVARIITILGCITTGNPFDVDNGDTTSGATTNITIPGALTSVAECLVLAIVADHVDSATNKVSGGTFTNADLDSLSQWDFTRGNAVGNGSGFAFATGIKTGSGTYGNTTATGTQTLHQSRMSIAFKPPAVATTTPSTRARITAIEQAVARRSRW